MKSELDPKPNEIVFVTWGNRITNASSISKLLFRIFKITPSSSAEISLVNKPGVVLGCRPSSSFKTYQKFPFSFSMKSLPKTSI